MITEMDQLSLVQKGKWKPIPRVSRVVPFGYMPDPDNGDMLLPVVLELEALEKAKDHLKQFSSRSVALWLHRVTGRYISHAGLRKRIDNDRHKGQKARVIRKWAARYKKAISQAEALERTYYTEEDEQRDLDNSTV